ncbi:MAG: 50S ribosomal protein L11 methyltransferase [Defluviitaleaceae bacterium]|nr:50S ribosomal protein L11 methyltransferase [Defluviitaleaceae bacterium]
MEWLKVEIRTTSFGAEIATAVLLECGVSGAEIINPHERVRHLNEAAGSWDYAEAELLDVAEAVVDEVSVVFYVEKNVEGDALLARVQEGLKRAGESCAAADTDDATNASTHPCNRVEFRINVESAHESAWADEWKKHFKPLRVGRVVIVPEWERPGSGSAQYSTSRKFAATRMCPRCSLRARRTDIIFTIDPGSAFGTGQHQSTQLCIAALQEYVQAGDAVLDIGCGSGILSIIALLLGARDVFACDIDPAAAIAATKANAALNEIDPSRLEIHAGDALTDATLREKVSAKKYKIIVANIVADVIIDLLPFAQECLADDGVFITSGIIDEREGEVAEAFAMNGLEILQTERLEGWSCIVGRVK